MRKRWKNRKKKGRLFPVLVLCYNLTLTHYLKRLLLDQQASLGRQDIQVMHFYEFCRFLLQESLPYENESADYYSDVTELALEAAQTFPPYGAVLVDEGQDFSDAMLAVLRAVVAESGLFWIALDRGQTLYSQEQDWLGDAKFRRFSLGQPYRATRALADFCQALLGPPKDDLPAAAPLPEVFTPQPEQGEKPILHYIPDIQPGADYLAERIHALHSQGIPYGEMLILYTSHKYQYGPGKEPLPEFLLAALEESGIMTTWVSRDAGSKSAWDITTDRVAISTIHSMKGMDAEAVFILGLEALEQSPMAAAKVNALLYVACSRARRFLEILYTRETPLIASLRKLCAGG
jgi:superfamily I DNA/RNA helicase